MRRKKIGSMTGMGETEEAQRARAAKADLAEILERRPDLKGKSIETVRQERGSS